MKENNKSPVDILDINDPIEAIKFYMAEHSLKQRDLAPMIGSRSKVSEVLSGKRSLTMPMARALHKHLGIPAEALLKEPATYAVDSNGEIDWRRFPLNQMAKRGWIEKRDNLHDHAEELISDLMKRAGCTQSTFALYRKTDQNRANAKTDPYALNAWCWQVLSQSNKRNLAVNYLQDNNPTKLMTKIAKISPAADGPRQAIDFLAKKGIAVEIVEHLPRTHMDGAAMKSIEGRPVIGLTLRYDRIDNFWWVLMHELAHVIRHLPKTDEAFVDDLRIVSTDTREEDADNFASECLIPKAVWENSGILENPSPMAVMSLAQEVGIHPAIVAGRARYELKNYRLLSQFVGAGKVRQLFSP